MSTSLQITASSADPALLDLPWELPLEEWPADRLAALPRGISRHVVRFVRMSGGVLAVKEIGTDLAQREYGLLRMLRKLGMPSVEPVGVVTGRSALDGTPLETALVTRHLQFSLPYRALFSQSLRTSTATPLVDALAVLLVRLHLSGFYWGDVSLSNTLFRRDAGAFAAYLVDAETGDLHDTLSRPARVRRRTGPAEHRRELMDLQAGGYLDETVDPVEVADVISQRYFSLWAELTYPESFERGERWRVDARIRRLNDLGFDVGELQLSTDIGRHHGQHPAEGRRRGHHSRRLLRLRTSRRTRPAAAQRPRHLPGREGPAGGTTRRSSRTPGCRNASSRWSARCRPALRGKLEPAEVYHEVLEHRWYLSERSGHDVGLAEAVESYIATVLPHKPDEAAVLGVDTLEMPVVLDDVLDEAGLDEAGLDEAGHA